MNKQCIQLLGYIKDFQLSDLLGIAKLLNVKERDPFEEYLTDIVNAFNSSNRAQRKKILRLAKEVSEFNRMGA